MSTKDYDPKYLEVWRDAGSKTIILELPSYGSCVVTRHKMYRLRADMRREKHPYADMADRAFLSIQMEFEDGKKVKYINNKQTPPPVQDIKVIWRLIFAPREDANVDAALAKVGYVTSEPSLD